MELVKQVCTLEQADVIDKLGVRLTCHFAWLKEEGKDEFYLCDKNTAILKAAQGIEFSYVSAYSCAELWWLFEIVLEHEKSHTLIYAFLHENATAMYKSEIPAAHYLADKIIEALKIKMVKPEDLTLED